MTTPFIPGAVYTTRGNPTEWQSWAATIGQALVRGPRLARTGHAFLAVDTDTILHLAPNNPDRRPVIEESSHPGDDGVWWRAWVPTDAQRADVLAYAWWKFRQGEEWNDDRYTYAACIRAGARRPAHTGQRCCSTYVADLLYWAGVRIPGTYRIHDVLPSDIARVANIGSDISHAR